MRPIDIEFRGPDGGELRIEAKILALDADIDNELPGYMILDTSDGHRRVMTYGSPGDFVSHAEIDGARLTMTFADGTRGTITLHSRAH